MRFAICRWQILVSLVLLLDFVCEKEKEARKENQLPLFSFCLWFGVRRGGGEGGGGEETPSCKSCNNNNNNWAQEMQRELELRLRRELKLDTRIRCMVGGKCVYCTHHQVMWRACTYICERKRERETYSRALSSSAMYVLCCALRNGMITRERRRSMRQSSVLHMCNTDGHASLSLSLQ